MRSLPIAAFFLLVFGLSATGAGHVARGSRATFERDPHQIVSAPGFGLPAGTAPAGTARKKKIRYVDVIASDFVYVASQNRVYATVTAQSDKHPNSIVEVVPKKARVVRSIPVGTNPRLLTLAGDDRTAYVVSDGPTVQRVDLATGRIVSSFVPQIDTTFDYPLQVIAIAVAPGRPETVAISFAYDGISGVTPGTAIYDDGARRPAFLQFFTPIRLVFGDDASVLYTYESGGLRKVGVDANGLSAPGPYLYAFSTDRFSNVARYNGLFYTGNGRVIDVDERRYVAWFPPVSGPSSARCAIDHEKNQIVYALRSGYLLYMLAYDLTTYRLVGVYAGPYHYLSFVADRMAFCGDAGLAMLDIHSSGRIAFYPRKLIEPVAPYEPPQPVAENGQVRRIPIPNNAFAYDPVSRKIYASVSGGAGSIGNSIVPIDPFSGVVGSPTLVGSEPVPVAVSSDGAHLYVGLWGSTGMSRFRLPGLEPDFSIDLYTDYTLGSYHQSAKQIIPISSTPRSVVVLHESEPWYSGAPGSSGIHVYDDADKRPVFAPDPGGFNAPWVDTIDVSRSGTAIYGLNTTSTLFEFSSFRADAVGVHYQGHDYYVGAAFDDRLHCVDDTCYTDAGLVIDGRTHARIGVLPIPQPDFPWTLNTLPDPERGVVYVLVGQERDAKLHVFDIRTLELTASYTIPNAGGPAGNVVLWGDGHFAFSTGNAIFLVSRSALRQ